MSFTEAEAEARERLLESLALLNHLRASAPSGVTPLDELQKGLRGHWLVSLYAAFERGVNAVVEASIAEISSHGTRSMDCVAPLHSIFQFSSIQSVKDCKYEKAFDSAARMFDESMSEKLVVLVDNPLANYLQNVDGTTLVWVCSLFGTPQYVLDSAVRGRLRTLRERRNALAHGREAASKIGERYSLEELATLYAVVDAEIARFRLHLQDYCTGKHYIKAA